MCISRVGTFYDRHVAPLVVHGGGDIAAWPVQASHKAEGIRFVAALDANTAGFSPA